MRKASEDEKIRVQKEAADAKAEKSRIEKEAADKIKREEEALEAERVIKMMQETTELASKKEEKKVEKPQTPAKRASGDSQISNSPLAKMIANVVEKPRKTKESLSKNEKKKLREKKNKLVRNLKETLWDVLASITEEMAQEVG